MSECKVKGCSGKAYHELPEDKEKRRIWTDALNLEVQYEPNTNVMCTEHFQMLYYNDVSSSKGSLSTASGDSYHEDEAPQVRVAPIKLETEELTEEIPKKRVRKRKSLLPAEAVSFLKNWLSTHMTYPYPTDAEKRRIAAETNLAHVQVTNWFINARRRILQPMLSASYSDNCSAANRIQKSCPPIENGEAGLSPHLKHLKNLSVRTYARPNSVRKKPKQKAPTSIRKNVEMSASALIDLTSDTSNASTSMKSIKGDACALPDSTVTIGVGGDVMDAPKARLKGVAERAKLSQNPKYKMKTARRTIKVVIPTGASSQIKSRTKPRTIPSTCDSQQQSIRSSADRAYTQSARIDEACRPQPSLVRAPTTQVAKPICKTPPSSGRRTKAAPTRTTLDKPTGEDLLNSLYENLFLKSPNGVEVKMEPDTDELASQQNKAASGEPSCRQSSPTFETVRVKRETTSSQTQTSLQMKDRQTQTSTKSTHTTLLSHEMFQYKPAWVVYHTGLSSYEQFKLVLNSLGPAAYDLTYRYSPGVRRLKVEDQLLMTLMKLRRAEPDLGLGIIFGVSKKTVENIITTWIQFMYREWSAFDVWPTEKITAREVFGPEGVVADRPVLKGPLRGKKLSNTEPQDRVVKLYKILSKNLNTHYRSIGDCILFVCCMLCDFRDSVIRTRKS